MSVHYLLDGYNIIHQLPQLAHGTLEQRREKLLRCLSASQPQGSVNNNVTVVFDGSMDHGGGGSFAGALRVMFTHGESADDYIKRVIDDAPDKKNYIIVSDDKGITLYVRAQGAQVRSVKNFGGDLFTSSSDCHSRGSGNPKGDGKNISMTDTQKINAEMAKIWLNEKRPE